VTTVENHWRQPHCHASGAEVTTVDLLITRSGAVEGVLQRHTIRPTGAMRIDVAITGADGVEDGVGGPEGVQHLRDVAAVASSLADGLADELRRKWAGAHT